MTRPRKTRDSSYRTTSICWPPPGVNCSVKDSFHSGLSVLGTTWVSRVCAPSTSCASGSLVPPRSLATRSAPLTTLTRSFRVPSPPSWAPAPGAAAAAAAVPDSAAALLSCCAAPPPGTAAASLAGLVLLLRRRKLIFGSFGAATMCPPHGSAP